MGIYFDKLFQIMERKGVTFYTLRKDKVIGTATITKLQQHKGAISTTSINNLCKYLGCQPGDIMEYKE